LGREGDEIECQQALTRVHTSSTTVSRAAQHGEFVGQFVGAAHIGEASPGRSGPRTTVTQAYERRERRLVFFLFFLLFIFLASESGSKAAHAARILY
jgi:hypothetical protein